MVRSSIFSSWLLSICWLIPTSAIAQVTPDGTLSTTVDSADGQITINNGDRAGSNLFHSFQEFSVPNNGSATFNNPADIVNIFSRVTGGNISEIEGAINAGGSANLLLINPAGIVFGENASLNIGGSFFATTADSLLFEGSEFSAIDPQATPLLSINRPIGLNFGNNPGSIINRSGMLVDSNNVPRGLEVTPGAELTFVGGEIQFDDGFATTAGGKIELGSVAQAGRVDFEPTATGFNLDYSQIDNFGDILFSDASRADASGLGGGEIRVQGRNIILTGGSELISNTFGSLPGKDIIVNASDSVQILGTTDNPELSEPPNPTMVVIPLRSSITAETFSTGQAGNIKVKTGKLILKDGGQISASSRGFFDPQSDLPGRGGNIEIDAYEAVTVTEATEVDISEIVEENNPIGSDVKLAGASTIATVTVNSAPAGNLIINTPKLTVSNGGFISTTSFGTGKGGNLVVNASETIDIFGESSKTGITSRIVASAITVGTSGDIRLSSEQIQVRDGGEIGARAFTIGIAGNIDLDTSNLLLDNSTLTAATQAGDRGNINVIDADTIFIRNGSSITTNATQLSTGGDINLDSEAIAIDNSSQITAIAEAGRGGNIQINSRALFREPNAEITAASNLGIDGTITFNDPDVDPTSGIVELTSTPIDADAILAQDLCRAENQNVARGSSLIVTGRGGLTPTSADSLSNIDRVVNWTDKSDVEVSDSGAIAVKRSTNKLPNKNRSVIQSQGFVVAIDGSLWLTANTDNTSLQNSDNHPDCQT